jgi:predicted metal-dependent hydrolase
MARPEDAALHPKAIEGLHLMNRGEYFEAHEALEAAWKEEPGTLRDLYKGILQAAVVYLHITRRNYPGAVKVYGRSQKWLTKWEGVVLGIDVATLRHDLDAAMAEVRRLGPERLSDFDQTLIKPVSWNEHPSI